MEHTKGFNNIDLKTSLSPKRFHLILFPTEECNFRCVYCYEDFSIGNMPDWLVQAVKTLMTRKIPDLDVLNLSWFGGEPLVAKNVLFDIAETAYELTSKNDCYLTGDITTNGFLLDTKTLTRLVSLEQKSFQISIDGHKETHDTTRLTRNGRGSFDKIWRRLMDAAMTDLPFKILLRVHVTAHNQTSVERFCELYAKELAQDSRFNLFFKAIENLGGDNQANVNRLIESENPRVAAKTLQNIYAPTESNGNYICYASKPNSLIIRANGALNKCTVALKDDENNIGSINSDGTLNVNNEKFKTWIGGFSSLDAWQMGCPSGFLNAQKAKQPIGDIEISEVV